MNKFRILSFDGGGARGLLSLMLLHKLEKQVPGWIDRSDLIAGTSTGAIIAIGLAAGATPIELIQLYDQHLPDVLSRSRNGIIARVRKVLRAEYESDNLACTLREYLGNTPIGALEKKILISAFDLDNEHADSGQRCWEPRFFHNLGVQDTDRMEVYLAALYSCATPVYFPSVEGYVDGAVTAQSPGLVALAFTQDKTLQDFDNPDFEDILLLSVGTGKACRFVAGDRHDWGYIQWTRYLHDMMLDGSVDLVDRLCRALLGERYHRLCPLLDDYIHADQWRSRNRLIDFGEAVNIQTTVQWIRSTWNRP